MENEIISGRYKIIGELGKGGFGQTFLAEDLHLPTKPRCVVKQLKPDFDSPAALKVARRLFEQEAEVLYKLNDYPYIPKLYAHFEHDGEFYLVQELIEGKTLAQILTKDKRLTESDTVEFLNQVLETLAFVHAQNVIHRDIKPTNIIRGDADNKYYLIDFGAVKQVKTGGQSENADSGMRSTIAVGSEGYMPSEQLAGHPRFSSDLYALGLVAVEALTGLHPLKLVRHQNSGEFAWQHKTQLHPEIEKFISKIVRYDFRQRYNSAAEAFAGLKIVASSAGLGRKYNTNIQNIVSNSNSVVVSKLSKQVSYEPTMLPTQAPAENLNPTVEAQAKQKYTVQRGTTYKRPEPTGFFAKLWNNDMTLGVLATILVLAVFFAGGYSFIRYAFAKSDEAENSKALNPAPDNQSSLPPKISALQEAQKQANEADIKGQSATTKADWEEVGNQWKRAYTLLASINETNSDYQEAQKRMPMYQQNSENAFKKSKDAPVGAPLISNTNSIVNPILNAANSAPSNQNLKLARMPAAQTGKMYIAFSSSEGDYIGGGQDRAFTEKDGEFSSIVSNGQVKVNFNGGADWWTLNLVAPQNVPLVAGTSYTNVQSASTHSSSSPGLEFNGSGRGCRKIAGNFTINSITYSQDGKNILLLDATFVQKCEETMPPLMGRIHYEAK